jgi:hypothetical protein
MSDIGTVSYGMEMISCNIVQGVEGARIIECFMRRSSQSTNRPQN